MVAEQTGTTLTIVPTGEGSFRRITIDELNALGYELTGRQMPIGRSPFKYVLLELKNDYNKQELSFCYLYAIEEQHGVILPDTYKCYLNKLKK